MIVKEWWFLSPLFWLSLSIRLPKAKWDEVKAQVEEFVYSFFVETKSSKGLWSRQVWHQVIDNMQLYDY